MFFFAAALHGADYVAFESRNVTGTELCHNAAIAVWDARADYVTFESRNVTGKELCHIGRSGVSGLCHISPTRMP